MLGVARVVVGVERHQSGDSTRPSRGCGLVGSWRTAATSSARRNVPAADLADRAPQRVGAIEAGPVVGQPPALGVDGQRLAEAGAAEGAGSPPRRPSRGRRPRRRTWRGVSAGGRWMTWMTPTNEVAP